MTGAIVTIYYFIIKMMASQESMLIFKIKLTAPNFNAYYLYRHDVFEKNVYFKIIQIDFAYKNRTLRWQGP